MFKTKNKLLPPFIFDLIKKSSFKYKTRSHYSITKNKGEQSIVKKYVLPLPKVCRVKTGNECFSHTGPILWSSLLEDAETQKRLLLFEGRIVDS